MRTSIFLILVAFTLSLFGQGNTIDWRDGRPGVRVVTNSLQTGEIMGLIDVAGQAKAGTGDVARIEGELVTHTDDAAIHLTSNQVVRIAQEHGGGITNETDEIALAALASHRHDRIVIQMDETHTRWIDATNGVWEGGSFMTNYTGWAVVIDSPVNINGEIIGPCTNIAPGIPYPLWTNPADSGTVVKVEMFGYREPMAFQYWHRPGHASPNYLYFYGDSEDSSAMWQSNYMTSGSTNKVRDMLGTDDNGIWSWVSIVYGVHTQKVDYARHIGTLAMEGGGGITNEQDLAALRTYHYGSPDIVESPEEWFVFDGAGTITAFNWEAGRENVVIPWAIGGVPVTAIVANAFKMSGIVSVIAPQTVTAIGIGAFGDCYSLASVSLPQVQTVGIRAFDYCASLASVSLPQAQTVGNSAFANCGLLASVSLPQVQTVGNAAFDYCYSLTSVYFDNDAPTIGYEIFENIAPNQVTNYVTNPTATGWGATFAGMPVVRLPLYADAIYQAGELVATTQHVAQAIAAIPEPETSIIAPLYESGTNITVTSTQSVYSVAVTGAGPVGIDWSGLALDGTGRAEVTLRLNVTEWGGTNVTFSPSLTFDRTPEILVTGVWEFAASTIDGVTTRVRQTWPLTDEWATASYAYASSGWVPSLQRMNVNEMSTNSLMCVCPPAPLLLIRPSMSINANKPVSFSYGFSTYYVPETSVPATLYGPFSVNHGYVVGATHAVENPSEDGLVQIWVGNSSPDSIATVLVYPARTSIRPANANERAAYEAGWRP